jgi:hypothetical protein
MFWATAGPGGNDLESFPVLEGATGLAFRGEAKNIFSSQDLKEFMLHTNRVSIDGKGE